MIQKNFVQVRLGTTNNSRNTNNIKHNLRTVSTEHQKNNNDNVLIYNNKIYRDNKTIKKQFNSIMEKRKMLIEEHNELYKLNNGNRKLRKEHSSIMEGIITFSKSIKEHLNNDEYMENLLKNGMEAANEISNKLNTEILYISLHLDEETPHFHFHMKNFDNTGASIFYKNKKKETLSELQDIVGEKYKSMGLRRGIKKEYTNNNHQKTNVWYDKKLKETKKQIQSNIEELKKVRKEISASELQLEQKRELQNEITQIQNRLRKIKRNEKEMLIGIKNETNKILENTEKTTFGNIDENSLKTQIQKSLTRFTKLELTTNEIEIIEKMKIDLENKLKKQDIDLENILKTNQDLSKTIDQQEIEIIELKNDNDYKGRQVENIKEILNDKDQEMLKLKEQNEYLIKTNQKIKKELELYKPKEEKQQQQRIKI